MSLSPASPVKDSLLADFETTKSPEVFEALVQRYSPMVLGVCRRILQSSDAEDAAQAVFVLLWQKAGQIKDGAAVSAWLHRTACNVCCNVVRSRLSRTRHEQHAGLDSKTMSREPADEMLLAELHKILDEEVNELPDKWRVPFVLFHLENRSLAEIAVAVGSSIPTVGAWLQRSRARLAERLRRRGVSVGSAGLTGILYGGPVNAQPSIAYVATLKISGRRFHRYQTLTDGRVIGGGRGTFLFVQNAGGNAIDFSEWQGTSHGIYDVDGDALTVCVTMNSGNRPDSFSTAANNGRQLHKYVRVK